ncbi:MAG: hypothetical protein IJ074_04125, partial [Clostridia bacterium]|nr:hypothetical protein [Clostridia bacterium]
VVPRTDIRRFCSDHPTMRLVSIDGADHRFKNEGELEKPISAAMGFWSENNGLKPNFRRAAATKQRQVFSDRESCADGHPKVQTSIEQFRISDNCNIRLLKQ